MIFLILIFGIWALALGFILGDTFGDDFWEWVERKWRS